MSKAINYFIADKIKLIARKEKVKMPVASHIFLYPLN